MAETLGDAVLVLRTDDRGLNSGIDQAEAKSRGLGKTLDATSGSATRMGGALVEAGAKAGSAANVIAAASNKVTTATGAQRAGTQQLIMNLNDMTTMWSMGARPAQIFSSQIGQVTQAVQLMSGGTSKLAAFMGGPWGIGIMAGVSILGPLVAKLFETEDATDKASKASETWAQKLDISRHSLAEVTAAMREYSAEQKKANEITLESAANEVRHANGALQAALALRQKLAAQLAADQASANANAGQGTGGAAGAYTGGQVDKTTALIAKNDAAIEGLKAGYQDAVGKVADALAKFDTDPTVRIKAGFDGLRNRARETIKDIAKLRAELAQINRDEATELKKAQDAKRESRASNSQFGREITIADARRIAGGEGWNVTSVARSYDKQKALYDQWVSAGRPADNPVARPGSSAHEKGNGLDIAFGAGVTPASIRKAFADEGVRLTKILKERGHFHIEWSTAGADKQNNEAEREQEKRERTQEAYSRDLSGLMVDAIKLRQQMARTVEDRYKIELEQLDIATAEQARRITDNRDYSAAQKATLLTQLKVKDELERQLIEQRKKEEQAKQDYEVAQAIRSNDIDLLQKQAQITTIREKRRDIEQQILDESYKQKRAALEYTIASQTATEQAKKEARDALNKLDQAKSYDQQAHDREFASPGQRYLREVKGLDTSLNDQMENVAVHGLQTLEDKLVDVIMQAKSLGAAFKEVAKQIIADLIRIGIQRAIIAPLAGLLFGPAPGEGGGSGGGGLLGALLGGGKSSGGGDMILGGALTKFLGGGSSGFMAGDQEWMNVMSQTGIGGVLGRMGGGGGGGLLGGLFSGMFADGGLIPTGTFGIVGERGPEPIISTAQGAMVRPNSTLSSMGRGNAGPGKLEISVSGARGNSEIMAMVRAGVKEGLVAYDSVVGGRVKDNLSRRGL